MNTKVINSITVATAVAVALTLATMPAEANDLKNLGKKIGGAVQHLGNAAETFVHDPVKAVTGQNATNLLNSKVEKTKVALKRLGDDPWDYISHLPASIAADICSAPWQWHQGMMDGQAHWKALPEELIQEIQPFYSVNLHSIAYTENAVTVDGGRSAQTIGNRIYFPGRIDLGSAEGVWLMAHELEHTVQFSHDTRAAKLCEYSAKAVGAGFQHDRIDMERAADAKADTVVNAVYNGANANGTGASNLDASDDDQSDFAESSDDSDDSVAPDQPSLAQNEVMIANDTDMAVNFMLKSRSSNWTPFTLMPHSSGVFPAADAGTPFVDIRVVTNNIPVQYRLDGGSAERIAWNDRGLLDVYDL